MAGGKVDLEFSFLEKHSVKVLLFVLSVGLVVFSGAFFYLSLHVQEYFRVACYQPVVNYSFNYSKSGFNATFPGVLGVSAGG